MIEVDGVNKRGTVRYDICEIKCLMREPTVSCDSCQYHYILLLE